MKCRVCKCTYERACDNGCGWAAPGLCTNCVEISEAIRDYREVAYSFSLRALMREVDAPALVKRVRKAVAQDRAKRAGGVR